MNFHWRRSRLHTRIVAKPNAALSNTSPLYYTLPDVSTIQNTSFTLHSTSWDTRCPTFCKISVPTLDTAARLNTSSFVLRFAPLNATCCGFETNLSAAWSQTPQLLLSTCSRHLSHFTGDFLGFFGECSGTCRLPPRDRYNNKQA